MLMRLTVLSSSSECSKIGVDPLGRRLLLSITNCKTEITNSSELFGIWCDIAI